MHDEYCNGNVYSEMATIQKRKSHGQTYWYIVESRRINGKPRPVMLAYLGKAEDLLERLAQNESFELHSYAHGDVAALLNVAIELDIVGILNKHIPPGKHGKKPKRDDLTVGSTFLLAALGRACCPTSKAGWYDWCKTTSLEYCAKRSFKMLDSQHFWDQMDAFPVDKIPDIEEEIIQKLVERYNISFDTLLFDTTNFFTFIDSTNTHCELPQRGKNKQKRYDLRQVGLALLVTREDQFPLFHKTYQGNKNDGKLWAEEFSMLIKRLKSVTKDITDITLVFDKGNNSKENFKLLDAQQGLSYVASLVPSYFPKLLEEANKNFASLKLQEDDDDEIAVYRTTTKIWGKERTCIVLISEQLREGQKRGIQQALQKKLRELQTFKDQLENPKKRKVFDKKAIDDRLASIVHGQYITEILKYRIHEVNNTLSFTPFIDAQALQILENSLLGRRILITNRDRWSSQEIILAYRAQTKIEYAFRTLKNPYHLALRPQYHWTDQKIEAHFFLCILAYLLASVAYATAKKKGLYKSNIDNFMDDLRSVRLAAFFTKKNARRGKRRVLYQLEEVPEHLQPVLTALAISNKNLRPQLSFSVYS